MAAELTALGLTVKTLAEIRQDLRDALEASPLFGPGVAVGDDSVLGQIIDPIASALAELHGLAQALYDASHPDGADGVPLDHVCSLNGVTREPASSSTGTVTATGTAGTLIPAGSQVRVADGPIFETTEDATIGGVTVDIPVQAMETGPIEAGAGAIDEIVTAVVGWTDVTNADELLVGQDVELDSVLRVRRERSLTITGSSTDQAIRARLEQLPEVEAAIVISNRIWSPTDSRGIPIHWMRVVVWPAGLDGARLAAELWDCIPGGIGLDGTEVYTTTDDRGLVQPIAFSYATERQVYVNVTVTPGSGYPTNGDTLVAQAVLDYAADLHVGDDVLPTKMSCRINTQVPGIDHLVILVLVAGWPTAADDDPIDIDLDEIATFDADRITVAS